MGVFGHVPSIIGNWPGKLSPDRLRRLVEAGILQTRAASDGSAYQEYVLTARGQELFAVVVALRQWGEQQLFAADEPHSLLLDRRSGQALRRMLPQAADGRHLSAADAEVRKLN